MKVNLLLKLFAFSFFIYIHGCDIVNQEDDESGEYNIADKIKYADIEAQIGPKERELFNILKSHTLTEKKLLSFIEALQKVVQTAGEEATTLFTKKHQLTSEVKEAIESIGWTPDEFYWISRKVGFLSLVVRTIQIYEPGQLKKEYADQMQSSLQSFEEMLQDPTIPESTKVQIRKSMQQMNESVNQWDVFDSKKMREKAKNLQGKLYYVAYKAASSEELALIKKYLNELMPILRYLDPSLILEGVLNDPDFAEE